MTMPNLSFIIDFENGDATTEEIIDNFAQMITSGVVWRLQGFYGRTANYLIEAGHISPEGEVLSYPE